MRQLNWIFYHIDLHESGRETNQKRKSRAKAICSKFCVKNISTNQKKKLVRKECSREYAHGLWEVVKFQITWFTRCKPNLQNWSRLAEFHYFSTDPTVLGSSCFASEAYHSRKRSSRMAVRRHVSCCLRLSLTPLRNWSLLLFLVFWIRPVYELRFGVFS